MFLCRNINMFDYRMLLSILLETLPFYNLEILDSKSYPVPSAG